MAVEATGHFMNIFPSQLIANRDKFMKINRENGSILVTQMDSSTTLPLPETLLPFYQSSSPVCLDPKPSSLNNSDSGLTCNNIPPSYATPRKRQRDSMMMSAPHHHHEFNANFIRSQKTKLSGSFLPLLDNDIVSQIQLQQSEIDRFIIQHTEKVKLELEEQRKRQSRMLVSAIQQGITKKLKEKDDEIQRMGKLNWVLQERVRSLCVENQIWRDLAHTNEATANSLRSDLEQVLAHVGEERRASAAANGQAAVVEDDAESSCGSCGESGREEEIGVVRAVVGDGWSGEDSGEERKSSCRGCGVGESRVLLLPCRHLCLCTMCGSTLRSCPVCGTVMTTSVHVNFS
ncbi:BOI-related E3 ubiquitin-protein ligase 1 [Ziziphus jujuba]|uniref:BOI-related E3 ubiquitin-protein ligase 1 n=1 Tax=Ziziphus jujuba TaxID=326968 RepID=A0A6P3ZRT0_ZIZJJ|nr:BOI-related E3 ubiquitin-protein ligase 1 [Ziziphus jujuba]